ncbi:MAG: EamA family transporter RarD [Firmicutes bacterium]|nr:EamA family transporter RarD [Bacillota bacterium]
MNTIDAKKEYREGLATSLLCQVIWGVLPIYWHCLRPIGSDIIIYYRVFTVALVCFVIAIAKYGKEPLLEPFRDRKVLIKYIISGALITANWSIYIWAVNADRVIQTCIGYYIEPVMICLFGTLIFKEKMGKLKFTALIFAIIAVIYILIYYRQFPGIALSLAFTFSIYAAIKKDMKKPPIISLLYETFFFAPFALIVIIYLEATGAGALATVGASGTGEMYKYFLMLLCGALTALPLGLYAHANNKVNMFLLGVSAYLSTTIALCLSIWVFKEPFDRGQLIAFIFIWIGLVFFTLGEFRAYKQIDSSEPA